MEDNHLTFPAASGSEGSTGHNISIPLFNLTEDTEGAASHIPHMDYFYDNSLQTGLMKDIAVDLELLGEHVILLGNQARTFPIK